MNKQSIIRLICVSISLVLALTCFAGCKSKKKDTASSSSFISDVKPLEDETSSDETTENSSSDEEEAVDDTSSYMDEYNSETESEEDSSMGEDSVSEDEDFENIDEVFYQNLTVNNTKYTNENFLGFNFIHQLINYYPDLYNRVYDQKQIDHELDTMKKMGVKMIRSYYGSSLAWDPVKQKHDFENEWMTAFYQNCLDMQKIGVEVGITPQWDLAAMVDGTNSLPTINGWGQGIMGYIKFKTDENGKTVCDVEGTADGFAKFVEESVINFESHGVYNVKQMFCFTEVNNLISKYDPGEDTSTSLALRDYERVYPLYDAMITAVHRGLVNAGVREKYQIVGPCDNWRADDGSEPYSLLTKYTIENLSDVVDVIGSHNGYNRAENYTNDTYYDMPFMNQSDPMYQALDAGKQYWIDEFNAAVNLYNAQEVAEAYRNAFKGTAIGATANGIMNMGGVSNVYFWALYDQQWPNNTGGGEFINGMHMVGFLPSLLNSTTPYPAWYTMSLLTRYVGQGKLFECEIGEFSVYISAIERNDGEITLLVTNYNAQEENIKINFEKSLGGKNLYRYLYNPVELKPAPGNDMIAADAVAKNVKTQFGDIIPAMSVAVYTTEKP